MSRASKIKVSTKNVRPVVAGKVAVASAVSVARPTIEQIALRAYALFEQEGRPDGRHLEHWMRAEAELTRG